MDQNDSLSRVLSGPLWMILHHLNTHKKRIGCITLTGPTADLTLLLPRNIAAGAFAWHFSEASGAPIPSGAQALGGLHPFRADYYVV